jgi:hypothetical protein
VENRRVAGGRTVQRHVLYLCEINDSQRAAWCQAIEAFDESGQRSKQIALFPEDRMAAALDCDVVHVRLDGLRLRQARQWGACWLTCQWEQLRLDDFWWFGGDDRVEASMAQFCAWPRPANGDADTVLLC